GLPASGVVTDRTGVLLARSEPATKPAATAAKPAPTAAKPAIQPVAAHRTTGATGASDDTLDVSLMIGVGAAALLLGLALAVMIPRLGSGGRSSRQPALRPPIELRPRAVPTPATAHRALP